MFMQLYVLQKGNPKYFHLCGIFFVWPVVSDVEKWGTITGQWSLKGDLSIGLKSEKS